MGVSLHIASRVIRICTVLLATVLVPAALLIPRGHVRAGSEEAIDIVVHPRSRTTRLSANEVEAIFTRSLARWSDGSAIIPFNLSDTHPTRRQFDRVVLRLNPEQVGRFWLDQRIRGLGAPPKQVPDPGLLVKVIERLPGSIGYVPTSRRGTVVKVVARIVDGRVTAP